MDLAYAQLGRAHLPRGFACGPGALAALAAVAAATAAADNAALFAAASADVTGMTADFAHVVAWVPGFVLHVAQQCMPSPVLRSGFLPYRQARVAHLPITVTGAPEARGWIKGRVGLAAGVSVVLGKAAVAFATAAIADGIVVEGRTMTPAPGRGFWPTMVGIDDTMACFAVHAGPCVPAVVWHILQQ